MVRIWLNKGGQLTAENQVVLPVQLKNTRQAWRLIQKWVKRSRQDKSLSPQKLTDYTVIDD